MMLLNQFVATALQNANKSPRIQLFLDLAGIKNKEPNKFTPEERFMSSFDAYVIYIKIILLFHYTQSLESFYPILPSIKSDALFSPEFCLAVAFYILQDLEMQGEVFNNYSSLFQSIQRHEFKQIAQERQNSQVRGIRFDVFASTLIEFITDERVKKFKLLEKSLKLILNTRKGRDFSLESFEKSILGIYGKREHNWIVARFTEFLQYSDEEEIAPSLNQIYSHFIPVQQDNSMDNQFYINFQKFSLVKFSQCLIQNKWGKDVNPTIKLPFNIEKPPQDLKLPVFDCINWMIFIEELYISMRSLLKQAESRSESVRLIHQGLLKDLQRLPRGAEISVQFVNRMQSQISKEDLIRKIERVVVQFVEVIEFALNKCKDIELIN